MSNEHTSEHNADQPRVYQVRLKGHLGQRWMDWFEGLTITLEEDGNTLLNGPVLDQSALHGILKKVRDLGMPLLSVNSIDTNQTSGTDSDQFTARSQEPSEIQDKLQNKGNYGKLGTR